MASYNEVMDVNARTSQKKAPKVLREIYYNDSDNGGHVFEHRFENNGPGYHEPEMYTFGKEEGRKALEHFAKHSGLTEHLKPENVEGDKDSAAGAAD